MDIVVTIPKTVPWEEYEKELEVCKQDASMYLNYRMPYRIREVECGDKCYVVHDGFVRGYQVIHSIVHWSDGFECEITGKMWPDGWYLQRGGPFHYIEPIPMQGFRGIRCADFENIIERQP